MVQVMFPDVCQLKDNLTHQRDWILTWYIFSFVLFDYFLDTQQLKEGVLHRNVLTFYKHNVRTQVTLKSLILH